MSVPLIFVLESTVHIGNNISKNIESPSLQLPLQKGVFLFSQIKTERQETEQNKQAYGKIALELAYVVILSAKETASTLTKQTTLLGMQF